MRHQLDFISSLQYSIRALNIILAPLDILDGLDAQYQYCVDTRDITRTKQLIYMTAKAGAPHDDYLETVWMLADLGTNGATGHGTNIAIRSAKSDELRLYSEYCRQRSEEIHMMQWNNWLAAYLYDESHVRLWRKIMERWAQNETEQWQELRAALQTWQKEDETEVKEESAGTYGSDKGSSADDENEEAKIGGGGSNSSDDQDDIGNGGDGIDKDAGDSGNGGDNGGYDNDTGET